MGGGFGRDQISPKALDLWETRRFCLPGRVTRLGEFSPNGRLFTVGPYFCATFSLSIDYLLIFKNNALGYILGDFFTNLSGHPATRLPSRQCDLMIISEKSPNGHSKLPKTYPNSKSVKTRLIFHSILVLNSRGKKSPKWTTFAQSCHPACRLKSMEIGSNSLSN
jgi:hypothetical protein